MEQPRIHAKPNGAPESAIQENRAISGIQEEERNDGQRSGIAVAMIGAIGTVIVAVISVFPSLLPDPVPLSLAPAGPTVLSSDTADPSTTPTPNPPQLVVERLWYSLNDGPEKSIRQEGVISVRPNDKLCLRSLEYSTSDAAGPNDVAHGEAYIRKPDISLEDNEGFDVEDGLFWLGDPVDHGSNVLTTINTRINEGCWSVGENWDRVVVALVHNGNFGWEVDSRLFVNLAPPITE